MKKIKLSFIAIACLLFVQNSYAQNANSNIEDEVSDAPNMLWQMVEQAKKRCRVCTVKYFYAK